MRQAFFCGITTKPKAPAGNHQSVPNQYGFIEGNQSAQHTGKTSQKYCGMQLEKCLLHGSAKKDYFPSTTIF